jgi:hypothetical protein
MMLNNKTQGGLDMPRILVALMALAALMGSAYAEPLPVSPAAGHATLFILSHSDSHFVRSLAASGSAHSTPAALACCKVCSVGKACGNTCISRDKTCHVGQGCACDG